MNTIEIKKYLHSMHPTLQNNVYPANRLPLHIKTPTYLVSNLDFDTEPGSHWIAIHIERNGVGQYFDSYGRPPTGNHRSFLNRTTRQWDFNRYRLQHDFTSVCGEYCLTYLYYKFHGNSMMDFVQLFDSSKLNNDLFVHKLFDYCYKGNKNVS